MILFSGFLLWLRQQRQQDGQGKPKENTGVRPDGDLLSLRAVSSVYNPVAATVSHNTDAIGNMLDGNPDSRWDTHKAQEPGMWVQLDAGKSVNLAGVVLDSTKSPNDAPRAWTVAVSSDATQWQTTATGKGEVAVDWQPVMARYAKVEQTGRDAYYWWSIHAAYLKVAEVAPVPTPTPLPVPTDEVEAWRMVYDAAKLYGWAYGYTWWGDLAAAGKPTFEGFSCYRRLTGLPLDDADLSRIIQMARALQDMTKEDKAVGLQEIVTVCLNYKEKLEQS